MSSGEDAAPEGAIETKTVQVAGFTEGLRKKELERLRAKMEAKGWTLQSYHDAGVTKSTATFSRPLATPGASAAPKKKWKAWHYAVAAVLAVFVIGAFSGGGDKPASSAAAPKVERKSGLLSQDMKAYAKAGKDDRLAAVRSYAAANAIPDAAAPNLYNFLSEAIYTKAETLKVAEVLGWAKAEMAANGGKLKRPHYNLDNFASQFSAWDGSHRNLEKLIKRGMNDEGSYKHIETRYRLVLEGAGAPYVHLTTLFSGKNAFGGTVKNTVSAKASITDGTILEIVQ